MTLTATLKQSGSRYQENNETMTGLNETNLTVQQPHSMGDSLSRHQVNLSVSFVASALVGLVLCYNNLWHLRVATNTRYTLKTVHPLELRSTATICQYWPR